MQDLIVFRFLIPFFLVLFLAIPVISSATDARDVVQLAAREAARKAAVTNDYQAVEQRALNVIQGSGKPIEYAGVTLFDPSTDVTINFYAGDEVAVTVHYRHYLFSPLMLTLIGGKPLGPTIDLQSTAYFEREW
ncbi:hypothetical protein DNHGIG_39910 [Collibacillus ludicampi]|uniref:DUF1310 family protein n=1 Tax=Collibacillus ludicampi TaxID=2771369 RepID=A0AAV4LKR7_9BACL|nr:hypothetical protein [Collibacillus ludicampi]GIM48442.1 hypothetical protein DNHGIG_39910 [Collibacillus ludicampi]